MNVRTKKILFQLCSILLPFLLQAQNTAMLRGKVSDENLKPVFGATITVPELVKGAVSDDSGIYEIYLPVNKLYTVEISYLGYEKLVYQVELKDRKPFYIEKQLVLTTEKIKEVVIESRFEKADMLRRIDMIAIDKLPTTSGGVEAILGTLGASIRSEFSSQYSVRGGNFDENLVYINDIEIYRPLLVKAGQQEGLSIINPDLVSSIRFSAGGFESRYGDKMASVLDIKYKRPSQFGGSIAGSLLGAAIHLEAASKNQKFTGIAGVRYKSNKYLLNSLQTKGDYKPTFIDFQSYLTYNITRSLEISILSNISGNRYHIVPENRETVFGVSQEPLKFVVYYDGQEYDKFNTYLGSLSLRFHPGEKLSLKLIGSSFMTNEEITYDIQGQYWINAVDVQEQNDSALNIGVGTYLQHARNYLNAIVSSLAVHGTYYNNINNFKWGIQYQTEDIDDKIREWEMIDSAGYSVPYSDDHVNLNKITRSKNRLTTTRITGYLQNTSHIAGKWADYYLNTGLRVHYWSLNDLTLVSPRIILTISPYWKRKVDFNAAFGYYYQPPFYKEMRDPEGILHKDVKAQKSIHYLLGTRYNFNIWERPFIFSTEIYYKKLWNLIPYKVEDVDIQYLPQYKARGYAAGIEFKINGEFVENAESWATLSILRTMEDIYRDYYLLEDKTVVSPGYYRRPTDQLINFGLFFQDYFPNNPEYKVHLNLLYGSNLPYGLPNYNRPDQNANMRPYQRVDIGLSKSLKKFSGFKYFKDVWFNFEVFNLFGLENQASIQWVRTVENNEGLPSTFGVPNYLTGRIFNFKLSGKF